jgi:dipeptidyl aminopeptidase/acylaminoacyl peptidase
VRSFADTNVWRLETSSPGVAAPSPAVVQIASTRRDQLAQYSPDGGKVAFISDRSGESEVWVADVSGTHAIQLTSLGANPGFPRWSPDGRMVVFHSNSEQHPYGAVFVVPAEGGRVRQVTTHRSNDVFGSFSSDGQSIYFGSARTAPPSIWKTPLSGGAHVQVSPKAGLLGVESPDGAVLYFVESGALDVPGPLWRWPLEGGEPEKLVDGVASTSFAVLAGGIYYLERVPEGANVRYFDFATRRSTVVVAKLLGVIGSLSATRDGRGILFSRVDASVDDLMLVDNFR